MKDITPVEFLDMVEALAATFEKEEASLNELDSNIGDGECGTNLRKAFKTAHDRLQSQAPIQPPIQPPKDVSEIVEQLGMNLITSAGGTIGMLFGVGIHAAGKSVAGTSRLQAKDVIKMGNAAVEAIKRRGKAQPGDKTFLDALVPAVTSFSDGITGGAAPDRALNDAVKAAREGAEATTGMVARMGRASYLGDRSRGHMDPGARALALALECAERHLLSNFDRQA